MTRFKDISLMRVGQCDDGAALILLLVHQNTCQWRKVARALKDAPKRNRHGTCMAMNEIGLTSFVMHWR